MNWILIGMKLLPLVWGAIQSVEHFFSGQHHGAEKQQDAMDMISCLLIATEGAAGRDLLNDQAVREATKEVIDAVVALQNLIATRAKH